MQQRFCLQRCSTKRRLAALSFHFQPFINNASSSDSQSSGVFSWNILALRSSMIVILVILHLLMGCAINGNSKLSQALWHLMPQPNCVHMYSMDTCQDCSLNPQIFCQHIYVHSRVLFLLTQLSLLRLSQQSSCLVVYCPLDCTVRQAAP